MVNQNAKIKCNFAEFSSNCDVQPTEKPADLTMNSVEMVIASPRLPIDESGTKNHAGFELTEYSLSDSESNLSDGAAERPVNVGTDCRGGVLLRDNIVNVDLVNDDLAIRDDLINYDQFNSDSANDDQISDTLVKDDQRRVNKVNKGDEEDVCIDDDRVNLVNYGDSSSSNSNSDDEARDQIILKKLKMEPNDFIIRNNCRNSTAEQAADLPDRSLELTPPLRSIGSSFKENVSQFNDVLDQTMTVLIQLRMAVEKLCGKKLFPYYVEPLLQLVEHCEILYEKDDCS